VNVVVLWLVDGEMCGKCGLLHVIFWRVEIGIFLIFIFWREGRKKDPGLKRLLVVLAEFVGLKPTLIPKSNDNGKSRSPAGMTS
jgi:hypothetical protein